ncbi:type II secretion system GspH family protein [Gammaproteobacteria bacterium]|nr:type II secretion system GspH family protein [Gammaproteobacteria bacterium]
MQILVIGKKNRNGFTLLELLMVLCIIGITSTYVLLNTSILDFIETKENPIEDNFKILSEESILIGKSIQWFANKSESKFYTYNHFNQNLEEITVTGFNFHKMMKDQIEFNILKSNGQNVTLEKDFSEYPLIIFFPSGENSGAKIDMQNGNSKIEIYISQNGKITKKIKKI